LTPTATNESSSGMANVLSEEKRQQVLALGRLGWPLRRIEAELGVRRRDRERVSPRRRGADPRRATAPAGGKTGQWGGGVLMPQEVLAFATLLLARARIIHERQ